MISFINLDHDENADRAAGQFDPEFPDAVLVNGFVA
jgi:hypothetical protein